jgi:TorA maturation chaperone TorD
LAEAAAELTPEAARDEFFELFIGVGRGEILPYASYYLTGFLHERPLALVREDMGKLGIARAERAGEPEDHIAVLMDIMANLIRGAFAGEGVDAGAFYARHIEPWGERLFADLEVAKASKLYRAVGRVGSLFLSIETEAGRLPS